MISRGSTVGPRLCIVSLITLDQTGRRESAATHTLNLSVLAKRRFDLRGLDAPVRTVPYGLAVTQDDRLRRFVAHARARRDLLRNVTRPLDDDERDIPWYLRHLGVGG